MLQSSPNVTQLQSLPVKRSAAGSKYCWFIV